MPCCPRLTCAAASLSPCLQLVDCECSDRHSASASCSHAAGRTRPRPGRTAIDESRPARCDRRRPLTYHFWMLDTELLASSTHNCVGVQIVDPLACPCVQVCRLVEHCFLCVCVRHTSPAHARTHLYIDTMTIIFIHFWNMYFDPQLDDGHLIDESSQ